jgi:four helix bundle protein
LEKGMQAPRKSRSYRDLEVWKLSLSLVEDTYKATATFAASENYGLSQQIRRAAVSIHSNLAEGQFRNSSKEFRQFLATTLGSSAELETQLIIANRVNYLSTGELNGLLNNLEIIMKMLNKLSISLT